MVESSGRYTDVHCKFFQLFCKFEIFHHKMLEEIIQIPPHSPQTLQDLPNHLPALTSSQAPPYSLCSSHSGILTGPPTLGPASGPLHLLHISLEISTTATLICINPGPPHLWISAQMVSP